MRHINRRAAWLAFALALFCVMPENTALAHRGGILVQSQDGKLVTGFDNDSSGQQTLGDRVFSIAFPSTLSNDIPSFLSQNPAPSGYESLPVGGQLYWDFLPMHWEGVTSNLLYWDGDTQADIEFGALPQDDITLSLFTENFFDVAQVDGSPEMVEGKLVDTVSADVDPFPSLHAHRWFFLGSETSVPEGIYLFAMQLRMEGLETSDPFFLIAGTDSIAVNTLDAITLPWVDQRVDELIRPGDHNLDGSVNGADFLDWQQASGSSSELVDWQNNYDGDSATAAALVQTVPEPSGAALLLIAMATLARLPRISNGRINISLAKNE